MAIVGFFFVCVPAEIETCMSQTNSYKLQLSARRMCHDKSITIINISRRCRAATQRIRWRFPDTDTSIVAAFFQLPLIVSRRSESAFRPYRY